jgi:hypothetical protein
MLLRCSNFFRLKPGRQVCEEHDSWRTGRETSAPSAWWFLNFYQEDERYPGYGVAIYDSGPPDREPYRDEDLLVDSLRLCRIQYRRAYIGKTLKRWDSSRNCDLPMDLQYVVVVTGRRGAPRDPQIGAIYPASKVFDEAQSLEDLVGSTEIQRGVLYDAHTHVAGHTVEYPIIENHLKALGCRPSPRAREISLPPLTVRPVNPWQPDEKPVQPSP